VPGAACRPQVAAHCTARIRTANKLEDRNTLAGRTSVCESAYARALAWYQGSGVVRLSGDSLRDPLH
jgi:hypothetical protein